MVNWDVVGQNWDGMKQQLREVAIGIRKRLEASNGLNRLRWAKA